MKILLIFLALLPVQGVSKSAHAQTVTEYGLLLNGMAGTSESTGKSLEKATDRAIDSVNAQIDSVSVVSFPGPNSANSGTKSPSDSSNR